MEAGARSIVTESNSGESDPGEVDRGHNVPLLLPLTEHSGSSEYVEAHDDDGHWHGDGDVIGWHVVLVTFVRGQSSLVFIDLQYPGYAMII